MSAPVGQKFRDLRLRAGLTLEEVAGAMGLARASSAQHYEEGYKKHFLPLDKTNALANLMEGRGNPPIRRAEVLALALNQEALRDQRALADALETGPTGLTIINEIVEETAEDRGAQTVAAAPSVQWGLSRKWVRSKLRTDAENLTVLTARGDSMIPTIHPGDKIVINMDLDSPSPQGIFALRYPDGPVLKRLELVPGADPSRIRVISDNPHYPEFERDAAELEILGKAVARLHAL